MARRIERLSAVKVSRAKPGLMLCDGGGLYLQTTLGADGETNRSWIFRFALNGRERQMGLGSLNDVSLAQAREKATGCRNQLKEGVDPLDARNLSLAAAAARNAKSKSFDECAAEYISAKRAGWSNPKHAQQWPNTLRDYVSPIIGRLPVAAIDTDIVVKVLAPIWQAKPETASRVRGRIEAVLDWAAAKKLRQGDNPARWRGNLEHLLSARSRAVEHHEALPYVEVGAFMAQLRKRDGIAARALEFTILTAARSEEVIGAPWDEIDLQARLWTVPASRMKTGRRLKAGRDHRVPLSAPAAAILERMARMRENDFVFPGTGREVLSGHAMLVTLKRMGQPALTVHGFRSTFRDWAAERTNYPNEMLELALAHAVSDKVEAAYRRGDMFDKRRQLMDAWAAYCAKPVGAAGEIVSLRPGARPNVRSSGELDTLGMRK
jgi:integrase